MSPIIYSIKILNAIYQIFELLFDWQFISDYLKMDNMNFPLYKEMFLAFQQQNSNEVQFPFYIYDKLIFMFFFNMIFKNFSTQKLPQIKYLF